MFGSARRKVTEHTINAMRPLIGILQNAYGIPPRFWQDEFVLGFLSFMLAFHRDMTSGTRLSDEDRGRAMVDVFTALSNMNGMAIGKNVTTLATAAEKSADFEKGADNASVMAFYSIGRLKNTESNEHLIKARAMASVASRSPDHSEILGYLTILLFVNPILDRFELRREQ